HLLMLHPARAMDLWCALAGCLACSLLADAWEHAPLPRGRLAAAALIAAIAIFQSAAVAAAVVLAGAVFLILQWGDRSRAPVTLAALALTAAIWRMATDETLLLRPPVAVLETASWARQRTPKDSTFLVPPEWEAFRAV